MMSASQNLLGFLLCCLVVVANDDGEIRTNERIYHELCRQAVVLALEEAHIADSSNVALYVGEDTLSFFFRQTIFESVHSRFRNVVLGAAYDRTALSFGVAQVKLRYGSPFSDGLFGPRRVERIIAVELQGNIIGSDRRIVWAGRITRQSADTVAIADIRALEKSSKHVATAPIAEMSFVEKILEPFVVITASAVVIYLFFTIRS